VKFWDTSALVPLVLEEKKSRAMRQLMISDVNAVVSFITLVELQSAIARRLEDDEIETRQVALEFLSVLQSGWTVADDYAPIIADARRLVSVHALRSGDAIQLASVHSVRRGGTRMEFVTLDEDLKAAARAEGFPVLP
jgi:uncharacterized protein